MESTGKQIEVATIVGHKSNDSRDYNASNDLDSKVNRFLKDGWKIMSAPVSIEKGWFVQQVFREIEYKSDFKKAVDILVEYQNCRSNEGIRVLREKSYRFTSKIRNFN